MCKLSNSNWLHIEQGEGWAVVGRSDRLEIGIKDDALAVQVKLML
jgi:hypothetical protein